MKNLVLVMIALSLSGCAQFSGMRENQQGQMQEVQELELANDALHQGRFPQAYQLFTNFLSSHQQSKYFQAARLGQVQALQGLEKWSEAATIARDVYLQTLKYQPEIAAKALYRLSFSYDALGEDHRSIAALVDAKRLGKHLPPEIALAEIPARLAVAYAREGQERVALKYLNEAEQGIAQVLQNPPQSLPADWLAKTYYQMGSVSMNQMSDETFSKFIRGQNLVQLYLIKSMGLNSSAWSQASLEELRENYRDLFNQVELAQKNKEEQVRFGGELIDLVDRAELYRPIGAEKLNKYEADFYSYLREIRKKTEEVLYSTSETMALTEESKRLNSIKRPGRVKADSFLPQEGISSDELPAKTVPSEDPNL